MAKTLHIALCDLTQSSGKVSSWDVRIANPSVTTVGWTDKRLGKPSTFSKFQCHIVARGENQYGVAVVKGSAAVAATAKLQFLPDSL